MKKQTEKKVDKRSKAYRDSLRALSTIDNVRLISTQFTGEKATLTSQMNELRSSVDSLSDQLEGIIGRLNTLESKVG